MNSAHRLLCSSDKWASTGSDSLSSLRFRVLHLRDICNPLTAEALPARLGAAGFGDVSIDTDGGRLRWHAVKAA